MVQTEIEFQAFRRENPFLGPLGPGEDPGIKYPRFRHYEYIPPRSASNVDDTDDTGRVIAPTLSPTRLNSVPGKNPTLTPTASSTTTSSSPPPPTSTPPPTSIPQGNNNGGNDGDDENPDDDDDDGDVSKPIIDCNIDENGDVNVVPNASKTFVDYKYKIITDSGSASLQTEVLPVLEKKILETILPDIFQCESGVRHLSWNLRNSHRKLALIGASANPPDLVSLNGKSCILFKSLHIIEEFDSDSLDLETIFL